MAPSKNNNNSKAVATKKTANAAKRKAAANNMGGGAAMTLLNTVAGLKHALSQLSVERIKLPSLTGIQGKSTIANALTKLKNQGFMIVERDFVSVTDAGMQAADPEAMAQAAANVPTSNAAQRELVAKQYKLKAKAVMEYMADGKTYIKTEVAAEVGCKMNSTFANLLTGLKKAGTIEFDRTTMQLTDAMFPFEPRSE